MKNLIFITLFLNSIISYAGDLHGMGGSVRSAMSPEVLLKEDLSYIKSTIPFKSYELPSKNLLTDEKQFFFKQSYEANTLNNSFSGRF